MRKHKKGKCILVTDEFIARDCVYGEKDYKPKKDADKILEKQPKLLNKLKGIDETCYIGNYVFFYQANDIRVYNKAAYSNITDKFNINSYLIKKESFTTDFLKNLEVNSYGNNKFYDCPYEKTEIKFKNGRIINIFKSLFYDIKRNLPEVYKKFLDEQGNKI